MLHVTRRPALARAGLRERRRPARAVLAEPAGALTRVRRRAARSTLRIVNWLVPKRLDACLLAGFPDLEDGVLALSSALVDDGRDVVVLVEQAVPPGHFHRGVRLMRRGSLRGLWSFLRSAHVIVTHGLYDNVIRPDRQVLVYLWHGESPNKKLDAYLGSDARPAGHAPVLSTVGQAFRSAEFGLPPTVVPVLGAPRNDRMLAASRDRGRDALDIHRNRTALLWMPTYREVRFRDIARRDSEAGYAGLPFGEAELRQLDDWLVRRDVHVYVKLHPVEFGSFRLGACNLHPLSPADITDAGLTTYTSLPAFDGLVTDVSSIWVDYLLLDRPILFAFPDIAEYRARRGFEVEPYEDWVPGRPALSIDQLTTEIGNVADGVDRYRERRAAARRLLHAHDDAASARRLVEYLFPR